MIFTVFIIPKVRYTLLKTYFHALNSYFYSYMQINTSTISVVIIIVVTNLGESSLESKT